MYQKDITNAFSNHNDLVTISFFKYKGTNIFWALKEMQLSKKPLAEVPGLSFFKIMGSGSGVGFKKPDIKVYALVSVWKNPTYAKNFFRTSRIFKGLKDHSKEWWTLFMEPISSKGEWSKTNPFIPVKNYHDNGPVAVFTRASLTPKTLLNFCNSSTGLSELIKEQDGLIFSKSLGEYPVLQQATFSIWENKRAVQLFAYHMESHPELNKIKNDADLFTEFRIMQTEGNWGGIKLILNEEDKLSGEAVHNLIKQSLPENTKIINK